MSEYLAPLKDIRFVMQDLAGLDQVVSLPGCEEATPDVVDAILEEAAKFAGGVLSPLNYPGDQDGARWKDTVVTTPPGFKEAYRQFVDNGWNALGCDPEFGGQGLPRLLATAVSEMWKASNHAFSLCPMLTQGAIEALMIAGSDDVIVDWRTNAFVVLDRVPGGTLVLLAGASHTGFDDAASGLPRALDNPDGLGCWVLERTLHLDTALEKLRAQAEDGDGVDFELGLVRPCTETPPDVAMDPARQQVITTLAVRAFLEEKLDPDPTVRAAADRYLTDDLPRDFAEASVTRAYSPVP